MTRRTFLLAVVVAVAPAAHAEELRPLQTRDARVDPVWSAGMDAGGARNEALPFIARVPSTRDVAVLPGIHFTTPLGSRAIFRNEWEVLRISDLDQPIRRAGSTFTAGDPRAEIQGTFWESASGGSHLGSLVAVKVPSAGDQAGAGTDRIDLDIMVLGSTSLGPARAHLNLGFRNRDVPIYTVQAGQDDLFHYGLALTLPSRRALWMFEVTGDAGSRWQNNFTHLRGGARVPFRERWTLYGAVGAGLTDESADIEGRAGISRTF